MTYRFTLAAIDDLTRILISLERNATRSFADRTSAALWAACDDLVRLRFIGHKRPDITSKNVLFYTVGRYYLIFERKDMDVLIHGVFHTSRNVRSLLKQRDLPPR